MTEFLPISSSGHLALARHILGAGLAQDVSFEVAVHAGTFIAVIIFFWSKIMGMFRDAIKGEGEGRAWILWLVIATIPAGVIGLSIKDWVEELFNNLSLVAVSWLFTAAFLYAASRWAKPRVSAGLMGWRRSLTIGIAQAVAILPGVSRSGATISAGLLTGVERKGAVDFSFILSLPVVGGAILLMVPDWVHGTTPLGIPHLAGAVAALVSGYFAIAVMLRVVARGRLGWFALYCALLGTITLMHSLWI